jgi:MoxR-like ATPase
MIKPFRAADHAGRSNRPAEVPPYECSPAIERAVNVALACKRPLLLLGDPGTGKSTLARYVAWCLERSYLEEVITSRTAADDLKWRFDAVRRLAAAQAREVVGSDADRRFVSPGVLWRAFNPNSAADLRRDGDRAGIATRARGRATASEGQYGNAGTVVLLDEIDKADPDVPNDLLVTIDARWFSVPVLDTEVEAEHGRDVLLVLTSNQERELPRAFVRRCIVLALPRHTAAERRRIAELHHPGVSADLLRRIDRVFEHLEAQARARQGTPPPSTAEYLDAVRACIELQLAADSPELDRAATVALWKRDEPPEIKPPEIKPPDGASPG